MGQNISTDRRLVCRLQRSLEPTGRLAKRVSIGWSWVMVIPTGTHVRAAGRADVIGAYITFLENSRVPPCAEYDGLTHAHSSGTCLVLPPRVCTPFEIALSTWRPIKRTAPYLSRPSHTHTHVRITRRLKYDRIDLAPDLTLLISVRGWRAANCVQILRLDRISRY